MLTDPIRAYLAAARDGNALLENVILTLRSHFGLTPIEAGSVIAQDLKERT